MNLAIKENPAGMKQSLFTKTKQLSRPNCSTEEGLNQEEWDADEKEDAFDMSVTARQSGKQGERRMIKKSMINRSCINTISFCCLAMDQIPRQLRESEIAKLSQVQKIDISYNNISDIHGIMFQKLVSLKQILLNDNSISELPFSEINQCKSLRLINLNNNLLYLLPPLTKVSYIEARNNPLRLVTALLVKLEQIQFLTMDWLDYLIQDSKMFYEDRFKEYTAKYSIFKSNILEKVNYDSDQNSNYCDFHSFFSVFLHSSSKQKSSSTLIQLIVRAILKSDSFFLNYLKNYQNELNYASMISNSKLLLQIALDNNNKEALELFRLKKENYSHGVNEQMYFQSLRLACRYSNYELFQYLIHIKNQRKVIQTKNNLSILIKQILERFDKQKQSDKILFNLVGLFKDVTQSKFVVAIPSREFDSKAFKSLSLALLYIYQKEDLSSYFEIENKGKGTPLHFAMKSRNQELLKQFLKEKWDVFERNQNGTACKYIQGCTQVSRKMIWKKEKQLIRKHWLQGKEMKLQGYQSNNQTQEKFLMPSAGCIEINSLNQSFDSAYYSTPEGKGSSRRRGLEKSLGSSHVIALVQDKILPYLFVRSLQFVKLSWSRQYSKKMESLNAFVGNLLNLSKSREEALYKRMGLWKLMMEKLMVLYQTMGDEDSILQYEIVNSSEMINGVRGNRYSASIKVEGQRQSIESGGFWCCQNVIDEG